MSLNYDLRKVEDWESLQSDESERHITDAVIWESMTVGLPEVTADNVNEWVERSRIVAAVLDAHTLFLSDGTPRPLTRADFQRRIGLRTNASPRTDHQFFMAMKRAYQRRLREMDMYQAHGAERQEEGS